MQTPTVVKQVPYVVCAGGYSRTLDTCPIARYAVVGLTVPEGRGIRTGRRRGALQLRTWRVARLEADVPQSNLARSDNDFVAHLEGTMAADALTIDVRPS
jgi:hypothetical protein